MKKLYLLLTLPLLAVPAVADHGHFTPETDPNRHTVWQQENLFGEHGRVVRAETATNMFYGVRVCTEVIAYEFNKRGSAMSAHQSEIAVGLDCDYMSNMEWDPEQRQYKGHPDHLNRFRQEN